MQFCANDTTVLYYLFIWSNTEHLNHNNALYNAQPTPTLTWTRSSSSHHTQTPRFFENFKNPLFTFQTKQGSSRFTQHSINRTRHEVCLLGLADYSTCNRFFSRFDFYANGIKFWSGIFVKTNSSKKINVILSEGESTPHRAHYLVYLERWQQSSHHPSPVY